MSAGSTNFLHKKVLIEIWYSAHGNTTKLATYLSLSNVETILKKQFRIVDIANF